MHIFAVFALVSAALQTTDASSLFKIKVARFDQEYCKGHIPGDVEVQDGECRDFEGGSFASFKYHSDQWSVKRFGQTHRLLLQGSQLT